MAIAFVLPFANLFAPLQALADWFANSPVPAPAQPQREPVRPQRPAHVTRRPMSVPTGAAVVGRNDSADCRGMPPGGIEWNPLLVRAEFTVDAVERCTRLHRCGQVAVTMFNQRIELPGRQNQVDTPERRAPGRFCTAPSNRKRDGVSRSPREDGSCTLGIRWFDDDEGWGRVTGLRGTGDHSSVFVPNHT